MKMNFSSVFIDRPIFASVIALFITLLGAFAYPVRPLAQYPEIAPPSVAVAAAFPGASAETMAETIAAPIEQEINGVEVFGVIPLAIAVGPGAEMRQAMGAAVAFVMVGVAFFGLIFTPVVYVVCRQLDRFMPKAMQHRTLHAQGHAPDQPEPTE